MSSNYYVIGSFYYEDSEGCDMLEDMISNNVISMGWAKEIDLTDFYGKSSDEEVVEYLKNQGQSIKAYSNIRRFLNIELGDMVAVKRWLMENRRGRIIVRAYARVVERNGKVYSWDKDTLGHMLNVKYLKKDLALELPYNYSQAIHLVTEPNRIRNIFRVS
jgi:hypothetical protein